MEITFDTIISRYNERNEFLIKIWIWIAIISIFGLLVSIHPEILKGNNFPGINVPISEEYFLPVYLIVLVGMILKWVDAFHRSVSLRIKVIEHFLDKEEKFCLEKTEIDKRKMIDGIVNSTTTSIWGIVPDFKDNKKFVLKIIRLFVYIFLKVITFSAHFVLPVLAIIIPIKNYDYSGTSWLYIFLIILISSAGSLAVLKTAYTEIVFGITVIKKQILFMT
jgi:hypothetical protein